MPLAELLPLTPAVRQWSVWGTTARIVVTDPRLGDDAQSLLAGHLAAVDAACSRFREDSELAVVQRRLATEPGVPVTISPLLAELVTAALQAADRTDGDVDPTLADDLAALGYDRDYALIELQSPVRMRLRLTRRNRHRWTDVRLVGSQSGGRRLMMAPGVHLDLGASAKAFAADRAAAAVAEQFGCGVLVSLGGDIATAGPAPAAGWQVLVQDGGQEPASRIRLDAGGLATSSTVSRRWRNGTRAVHHILDPASGQPAEPVWRTVSVAAASCAEANALSTAAVVRGWQALDLLRAGGNSARLVGADGEIIRLGHWPVER
jgi:thiamine biosynthesis lipoprotein